MPTTNIPHRQRKTLPAFNAQPSGANTISAQLPLGQAYEGLLVHLTDGGVDLTEAECKSMVARILLEVNGEAIIDASAADLMICLCDVPGDALGFTGADDGYIYIPIVPVQLLNTELATALRLGTEDVSSVVLTITFGGTSDADGATLEGIVSDNAPAGAVRHFKTYTRTSASTGDDNWFDAIPRTPGASLLAIHVNTGATPGVASKVEYSVNDRPQTQLTPAALVKAGKFAGRTPQSTYYTIDVLDRNLLKDAIPFSGEPGVSDPVNQHNLKLTWSTAPGLYRVLTEVIKVIPPAVKKADAKG